MLWTIFVIMLLLWALGAITGNAVETFLYVLLLMAVAMVLIRVIRGQNPL